MIVCIAPLKSTYTQHFCQAKHDATLDSRRFPIASMTVCAFHRSLPRRGVNAVTLPQKSDHTKIGYLERLRQGYWDSRLGYCTEFIRDGIYPRSILTLHLVTLLHRRETPAASTQTRHSSNATTREHTFHHHGADSEHRYHNTPTARDHRLR